jgi:hypothetical protein
VITQPTSARLIDVVREELRENVLPKVAEDPAAAGSLHMIDQVLETLSRRATNEIAWMVEEVATLDALGERVAADVPAASKTAAAVDALRAMDGSRLDLASVSERYASASEILSCAVEEVPLDAARRGDVEAALDARLAHELEIIGDFQLVGRQ